MALSHLKYNAARTGDILLFQSWSLLGIGTRVGTRSEHNHAAIALWLDTAQGRRLHLLESAALGEWDVLHPGEKRDGVSIVDLDQVLHKYDKVLVRKVKIERRDDKFYTTLRRFINKYKDYKFRKGIVNIALMNAGWRKPDPEIQQMFCSEFCAYWLRELGLVSDEEWEAFPPYRVCPGNLDEPKYFTNALIGNPIIIYDSRMDDTIKICWFAIEMAALFLYILLAVQDEKSYHEGHRRRKVNREKVRQLYG